MSAALFIIGPTSVHLLAGDALPVGTPAVVVLRPLRRGKIVGAGCTEVLFGSGGSSGVMIGGGNSGGGCI